MDDREVAARLGIEDTIARYARCADSGRSSELAELFTQDGVLVVNGDEHQGRASITAFIEGSKSSLAASAAGGGRIRHHVSSLRIDFPAPDEARATSYFLAVTAAGPDHWGVYRDRLVLDEGRWCFARREAIPEGFAPGGWQGTANG